MFMVNERGEAQEATGEASQPGQGGSRNHQGNEQRFRKKLRVGIKKVEEGYELMKSAKADQDRWQERHTSCTSRTGTKEIGARVSQPGSEREGEEGSGGSSGWMVRAARDSILGRAVQRKEAGAATGAGAAEEQEEKAELTVRCAKRDAGGREPDSVYMVGVAEPIGECEPARASSWNVGETNLYEKPG